MPRRIPSRHRVAVRAAAVLATVAIVGSVWYVQAPPRSAHEYRAEARRTAETLSAQLDTARLWAEAVRDDSATHQAATVAFRETEADAEAAASAFAAHQPPRRTEALRRRLTTLADDVTGKLAELRILAHRARWEELPRWPQRLARSSAELDALARELAP